jgi:coenzyme F420-reducing hydrogenase beta subunit
MGAIEGAWLTYASDEPVRREAASGGSISALLIHLLKSGRIVGAIVVRNEIRDGQVGPVVELARAPEAILAARTSKYFGVPLLKQALELIHEAEGPVAITALPCHATALRKLAERDPDLKAKLKYIVTLFCNHSSERELLDEVLRKNGVDPRQLSDFYFRRGHWGGHMGGRRADGSEFRFPFKRFSYYFNLHFFTETKCLYCNDHTGYDGDFAAGDAWLREMKDNPIKHTILVARHTEARAVIEEMIAGGSLHGEVIDQARVFRSQKRALIYHYNTSARNRVAPWFGMKISDTVGQKVRWNDRLAAGVILFNHKWSEHPRYRKWIFRLPWPLIVLYFLFLKFLQNF